MAENSFKLLREFDESRCADSIVEENEQQVKKYFIEGITLQSEVVNGNGRFYPYEVLRRAVDAHATKFMAGGRALGELNHPSVGGSSINYENVSHKFISVREEGGNFITRAEILNTPKGQIVKSLIEGGVQLAISSRGLGRMKRDTERSMDIVQELHLVSFGDIVSDPSGPNCFVDAVMENKEWVYENGLLVERDLSEEIDQYKQVIESASSADLQQAIKSIFSDYMSKLLETK